MTIDADRKIKELAPAIVVTFDQVVHIQTLRLTYRLLDGKLRRTK